MNSHQSPTSQRHRTQSFRSPAIVSRRHGESVFVAIEMHRRRTGWRGPVIVEAT